MLMYIGCLGQETRDGAVTPPLVNQLLLIGYFTTLVVRVVPSL